MGTSCVIALGNHPVGTGWKVNNILLHDESRTTCGDGYCERRDLFYAGDGIKGENAAQVKVDRRYGESGEVLESRLFCA